MPAEIYFREKAHHSLPVSFSTAVVSVPVVFFLVTGIFIYGVVYHLNNYLRGENSQ
jgi:hypothetical protein